MWQARNASFFIREQYQFFTKENAESRVRYFPTGNCGFCLNILSTFIVRGKSFHLSPFENENLPFDFVDYVCERIFIFIQTLFILY